MFLEIFRKFWFVLFVQELPSDKKKYGELKQYFQEQFDDLLERLAEINISRRIETTKLFRKISHEDRPFKSMVDGGKVCFLNIFWRCF